MGFTETPVLRLVREIILEMDRSHRSRRCDWVRFVQDSWAHPIALVGNHSLRHTNLGRFGNDLPAANNGTSQRNLPLDFGVWFVASLVIGILQYRDGKPVVPNRPQITIETFSGLPEGLTGNSHLRFHRLLIRNNNPIPIESFCSRLQLPEPIFATLETNRPAGTALNWHPLQRKVTINGTGNREVLGPSSSVENVYDAPCFFPHGNKAQLSGYFANAEQTGVWELTIDKLPPYGVASLLFLTSNEGQATNYIDFVKTAFIYDGATIWSATQGTTNGAIIIHNIGLAMIVHTNKVINTNEDWHLGTNELRFSFEGDYQYAASEKLETQHFLMPIIHDPTTRRLSSPAVQPDDGRWKRVMVEFQ